MANKIAPLFYQSIQQSAATPFRATRVLGINEIVKQRAAPMNLDEKFKVLITSNGSMLQASLSANDSLVAKVGSICASFGQVDTQIKTLTSMGQSMKRKFAGGSFYLEEFIAERHATVLVGHPTSGSGDVAVVKIDPTQDIIFRSEAFLAFSGNVKLDISPSGFGLGDGGFFFGEASGDGILALSKPGSGLISVKLEANQTMNVNPRNVVGWDSSMNYEPVVSDAIPSQKRAIWRNLEWMTAKGIPFRHAAEATLFYFHSISGAAVHYFRYWVIGERGLYRFSGPGQIFISTTSSA